MAFAFPSYPGSVLIAVGVDPAKKCCCGLLLKGAKTPEIGGVSEVSAGWEEEEDADDEVDIISC